MTGTILVVDDDEAICDLMAETLAPHTVLLAITGEDALRILRSSTPVDVLLTDVVLPGRYDGFALARQAKALRPALKVFYASGYYSNLPAGGDDDTFYGTFIAKPFRVSELRAEMARALAEPANQGGKRSLPPRWRQGEAA